MIIAIEPLKSQFPTKFSKSSFKIDLSIVLGVGKKCMRIYMCIYILGFFINSVNKIDDEIRITKETETTKLYTTILKR